MATASTCWPGAGMRGNAIWASIVASRGDADRPTNPNANAGATAAAETRGVLHHPDRHRGREGAGHHGAVGSRVPPGDPQRDRLRPRRHGGDDTTCASPGRWVRTETGMICARQLAHAIHHDRPGRRGGRARLNRWPPTMRTKSGQRQQNSGGGTNQRYPLAAQHPTAGAQRRPAGRQTDQPGGAGRLSVEGTGVGRAAAATASTTSSMTGR